jgi:DNA-binding NarL/FixJ family response regulator
MTGLKPVTVALVDDHELVRDGIRAFLGSREAEIIVVASTADVAALRASQGWGADVVLLDLDLRDGSTVEDNIATIAAGGSAVVIVSVNEDAVAVRRAMRGGAMGYVPKSAQSSDLIDAILASARGESFMTRALALALVADDASDRPVLSPQEVRVLQLYAGGMPLKLVARRLDVQVGTVKSYVDRIRRKYGKAGREAATKLELHWRAVEDGYVPPP